MKRRRPSGLAPARLLAICLGALMTLSTAVAAEGPGKGPASAASAPSDWTPSATGDAELAARALDEAGATTSPSRVGLGTYLKDFNARIQQAIGDWLENVLANAQGLGRTILFVAQALVWAAALAGAIWLFTILLRVWRRRGSRAVAGGEGPFDDLPALPQHTQADAAAWRQRLADLLAADNLEEALEAMWWWLARSLAGPDADPSWTSRDLMERFRRRDLLVLVRRLDAFQYGPRRPSSTEVEHLARDLERDLDQRLEKAAA